MYSCSVLRCLLLGSFWALCPEFVQATGMERNRYVSERTEGMMGERGYNFETVVMETEKLVERQKRSDTDDEDQNIEKEYVKDNHEYYEVSYYSGEDTLEEWWVDMDSSAVKHETLSSSDRRAAPLPVQFNYKFYGHDLSSVVVTTGGFLYLGTYLHPYLAATQYVAPLMANFDLSSDELSYVKYNNSGAVFTVEWHEIQLKERNSTGQHGRFTFQVSIFNDSRIVFAYKEVPVPIDDISSSDHPVKAGVSDAYYNDIVVGHQKIRRQIHQYHAVELDHSRITSNSVVVLKPLPTCNNLYSCNACENSDIGFNCTWCVQLDRCSSGFDRYRQEWVSSGCQNQSTDASCERMPTSATQPTNITSPKMERIKTSKAASEQAEIVTTPVSKTTPKLIKTTVGGAADVTAAGLPTKSSSSKFSLAACVLVVTLLVIAFIVAAVWVVYAYRNPTTKSGLFLIQLQRNRRREAKTGKIVKYKYKQTAGISSLKVEGNFFA
ncbi:plexin domain-containing protein 2-like [Ptychodera flava]|uniref:plexin domain-containing protein 2-like n=1 Tax=Ptychodera flava TaxID=63121 RepID=UPI00396A0494